MFKAELLGQLKTMTAALPADDQRVRAEAERGRADSAEARIRELEEENRRLRGI